MRATWFALGICTASLGCANDDVAEEPASIDASASGTDADASTSSGDTGTTLFDASAVPTPDAAADTGSRAGPGSQQDAGASTDASSLPSNLSEAGGSSTRAEAGADSSTPDAGFPPLAASVTLHIAGDSTSAIFPASDPTHRVGWAAVLQPFFSNAVQVNDAAQSGRSSKSFIDEGLWKALKTKIHAGDYVFIEFGHNDEKTDDPARYTDAASSFRSYLKTYVSETRAAGGIAVLLTPISRRQFSGSKIVASHGAYPAAVIAVAMETGTPWIDMTDKTRVWLESLGPTASVPMFATDDNTHLSAKGAQEVAKLAVEGIRVLALPLAARLVP